MVEKSEVRILVLDDEAFMLKLLGHMLAKQGYTQVTTFDNGQAALLAKWSPPSRTDSRAAKKSYGADAVPAAINNGELKVDRSFVHGAASDATVRAIYEASLALAKQLDMDIVAEGVEDQADWDFLRRTGCHLAQGYFIGRPMPAGDLLGWIADWQERMRSGFAG